MEISLAPLQHRLLGLLVEVTGLVGYVNNDGGFPSFPLYLDEICDFHVLF